MKIITLKFKNLFLIVAASFLLSICGGSYVFANQPNSQPNSLYFVAPNAVVAPNTKLRPDSMSEFTVSVMVNTTQPINALDLEIAYPQDKLKFIRFDNAHSIVDIWQATTLDNNSNIDLTGGISQSFTGNNGLIINLVFKALTVGQPVISFAKNNIYLADGQGTKASIPLQNATISITEDAPAVSTTPTSPTADAETPIILFQQIKSPADGSTLIAFEASDALSGIKQIQMRYKDWFSYSHWINVQTPVLYPAGAWEIQLQAINNAGGSSAKTLISRGEVFQKILLLFFLLCVLVFIFFLVYNKRK